MRSLRTFAAVALSLFLSRPEPAKAQYLFTPIDVPGAAATYADGNSTHEIVGEFDDEDGNTHGFVLSKGVFTQFDEPSADGYTSVNGINANGERSGIYFGGDRFHGYFWSKGVFTTLDPSGSTFSVAEFLNAQGQVVGYSVDAERTRHGFVWSKGVFTTIDVPGAGPGGTRVIGINDHGQIVGSFGDTEHITHGFVLSKGVYTTLAVPGADGGFTIAEGINNAGQIVGYYSDADGTSHGFLFSNGAYTMIDVPGSFWTEVYSINAKGEIVGAYEDADGVHGLLGTPQR
jgi:probable HAF family extracellular repeat protein